MTGVQTCALPICPISKSGNEIGKRAHSRDIEYCKERLEHVKLIKTKWGLCCLVFADRCQSLMGIMSKERWQDTDFFVKVDLGTGKLDFRTTRDDLNVGLIAKEFGGGGHPKAAGAYLSEGETDNILLTIATAFNR